MRRALAVSLLSLVVLVACGKREEEKPTTVPGEKVYALKGKIVSRDKEAKTLDVDHEAIPGFMEAMTMSYPVRGAAFEALPPDQSRIEAKLHVTTDDVWLTDIRKAP
jgi:protein SCO1/2